MMPEECCPTFASGAPAGGVKAPWEYIIVHCIVLYRILCYIIISYIMVYYIVLYSICYYVIV